MQTPSSVPILSPTTETVERDILYAYQGLKDTTKDAEPVEDHLLASIHQVGSNLHSEEIM